LEQEFGEKTNDAVNKLQESPDNSGALSYYFGYQQKTPTERKTALELFEKKDEIIDAKIEDMFNTFHFLDKETLTPKIKEKLRKDISIFDYATIEALT
jgi:hypothetical protein